MRRVNRGFTLAEIAVVVVITVILGAMAVPRYFSYNQKAAKKAVFSDLKGLHSTMETYYSEKQQIPSTAGGAITGWTDKYSARYTYTRNGARDYQFKYNDKISGVYIYIDQYGTVTETHD